jgi:alcohol dehydrogenase (quinone), cytochrome c subunit
MKRLLIGVLLAAVLAAVAVLLYAFIPTSTREIAAASPGGEEKLIERGRYLAAAGDCTACHTAPNGKQFAGGLPIPSPIGTIFSTNITPDRDTGIGAYTLTDFDRAVRYGIARNGGSLYPAMPYPSFARISDDDVRALYAYFMLGVQPVKASNRAADIPWPLSMRWPLAIWRKTFAPSTDVAAFDAKRYSDPRVARGAYLVQGLGHCGACHTPREVTLQEQALDERSKAYLAGGQIIDGWYAVNLRGNTADGLGNWSAQDIVDTLRSARNIHAAVIGATMGDVVVHSTQHLTDDDLEAIAAYLKTLPAAPGDKASFANNPATAKALQAGINDSRGAQLYVDNCSACHRTDGKGYAHVFPEIAGNPSVLAEDPTSLIRLILKGSSLPPTATAPSALGMPGFAWRLSDEEVAQLATFARNSFGNRAGKVDAAQVASIRKQISAANAEASSKASSN